MNIRIESDSLGDIEVPADRYWGAQTQRSLQNFKIGEQRFGPPIIRAFGIAKQAAALTNLDLGKLDKRKAELICDACNEVIKGDLDTHFPLVVWQTGSGTPSNLPAPAVLANRAIEIAGGQLGSKQPIHPNDDVNMSQSSNDTFPAVMHIAAASRMREALIPAMQRLHYTFDAKAGEFADIVKIGRTHMMDATPLTLGMEFSGYAAQIEFSIGEVEHSLDRLYELALGGSAVGTGLNTHPQYAERVAQHVATLCGLPFRSAPNKFMALAAHDAIVSASGALRQFATACLKIANDIRLLASGPRSGLGEISIPANEPGSSIMPGKVNPTQAEALTMVATQVIGNDVTIGIAGSQGHLELNVYKPVMIHNLLESIQLLGDACDSFNERCAAGIEPNHARIREHLENSLMLVTALNPVLGYDQAARVAKTAYRDGISLREAVVKLGLMSAAEFDEHVDPSQMIRP